MTIIYTPAIAFPVILMAVFGRQLCPPIPAVLFLIASGSLANYFLERHRTNQVLIRAFRA